MTDFDAFLQEIGISHQAMEIAARSMPIPLDRLPGEPYLIGASTIHGKGVFATAPIAPGEDIALFKTGGDWTQAGRYMNHAARGNCLAYLNGTSVRIRALASINPGDEITVDYRQVYRLLSPIKG